MKKYILVLFTFLFLFFTEKSFSQGINSILALDNSNVIAAGNNGKVIRSSNAGNTWNRNMIGTVDYKCISSFNNDVWIGASDGKVYKTTNLNSPLTGYTTGLTSVNGISFANSLTGYVCGIAGGVYKTTDGGLTWNLKNTGIGNVKLNAINFQDDANGIAVGDNGAAYLTSNGANNWSVLNSGTTRNLLAVEYYASFNAYITGEWGVIIKFSGTPTLTSVKSRTTSDIRAISGTGANDIHIVGGGGFIRNNKNGSTEFMNFETNPMMGDISSISYLNETTGYAVSSSNDAIIKTTNGGQSWFYTAGASMNISWVSKLSASNGIGNTLCLHPANRDVLYVVYGKTIYRSFNRGDSWVNIGTVGSSTGVVTYAHSFYVSPVDSNIFICAIEGTPLDQVVRSTNYGTTWTTIVSQNFSNYGAPLELDQNTPGVYYFAPEGGQFFKSTNNGATFNVIGFYPFRSPCDVIVEWGNSNNIMVTDGVTSASTPADIFKSTDGGTGWVKVHTNSGGSGLSEIPSICNTVFSPQLAFCTNWSGSNRYKTTNGGDNWSAIAPTTFSGWASDICREDPTLIITGNYGQNSSLSTNGGANWTAYPMPSGGCGAGMIAPERNYLIAQQCSGLLKMQINYLVDYIDEEIISSNIPSDYALYQNYPNPFNPSTEIKYDVLKSGMVTVKVYDETGKQIYNLVNGIKSPGTYSVKFNAESLSSGMYYYVLESGGIIISKKMVLVK
jgi:photosystem II stability/assembly factor-like uncharacterized protein